MNIQIDSRKVKKGDLFVALKTLNHDGHDYVMDAIKNGASKVIVERGNYPIETEVVPDTREYLASYLKEHYYEKIKHLKLIGMTGTNGKTTTCFCIWQALNLLGHSCAYIGTIGFYKKEFVKELPNTTPELLDIYEMLLECEDMEYVVMEVSSHALSMKRVEYLPFEIGIFSNLTEDHLDYHKNMEDYAKAKQQLFYQVNYAVVNLDDPYASYFLFDQNKNITYGFQKGDYRISSYRLSNVGSKFTVESHNEKTSYDTKLLGKHNLMNLVCVLIVLDILKLNKEVISEIRAPRGRMETFSYHGNLIVLDYAHTPDAEKKVIETVKEFSKGKIYIVIGCGGDRDPYKRPIMAKIATDYCDYAIFTNDNPRTEDPKKIFYDMTASLKNRNYQIIENREKAIETGIQKCQKNDILLILGKGHENYQLIGNVKTHFDDKEMILKYTRS